MNKPAPVADLTGFDILDPYFWKSEEQILLLRHAPGPSVEDAGHFEALVHDLTTQRREPLAAFNAACAPLLRGEVMHVHGEGTPDYEIAYVAPPCSLSPDRQWIAASPSPSSTRPALTWLVAPLEPDADQPPQTFDTPDDLRAGCDGNLPVWLPDSRRWVAPIQIYISESREYQVPRLVVHDTRDPAANRSIAVTDLPGVMVLGVTTAQCPSDGGASGEVLLLCDLELEDALELYAVPLDADTSPVQAERWAVPLPGRCHLWQAALSPDGRWLAWLSEKDSGSRAGSSWGVWVGGLNGEEMRQIGTMPEGIEASPGHYLLPCNLAWLSTGRAVSYRYGDALWVAGVD